PDRFRRAIQNAGMAIGDDGKVLPPSGAHLRTPLTFHWRPAEGQRELVAQPGTAVRIGVHSTTPPSTPMDVRIIQETEESGETILHIEYVPAGRRMWFSSISIPILSGAWLSSSLVDAGGASGVSVSLIVNVG